MSLDNVLAVAGAAHGNIFLVLFGLVLSIPIIMLYKQDMFTALIPIVLAVVVAITGFTLRKTMADQKTAFK